MKKWVFIGLALMLLIWAGGGAFKVLKPIVENKEIKVTSDAKHTKVTIRGMYDPFLGYYIAVSDEFVREMRRLGIKVIWEPDEADYGERNRRLENGEIDFCVATVDAEIESGYQYKYPGRIVFAIDISQGADMIIGLKSKVPNIKALRGKQGLRVAYMPGTPSHFLLKGTVVHFKVPALLPKDESLHIKGNTPQEVVDAILTGKADVGALWEPFASKVLKDKKFVKLLGSDDTERYIVDVMVASKRFIKEKPDVAKLMIKTYFRVLKKLKADEKLLMKGLRKYVGSEFNDNDIREMLKGVHWITFEENCKIWFPVDGYNDALYETIENAVDIFTSYGDFPSNPLPQGDPYSITYRTFLEELYKEGIGVAQDNISPEDSLKRAFTSLAQEQWKDLSLVGPLNLGRIDFEPGRSVLTFESKQEIEKAIHRLKKYPNFRIIVEGHTGSKGRSAEEFQKLSEKRAKAVARRLMQTYKIHENRLLVVGHGGTKPPPPEPGENEYSRGYRRRLKRVELVLVKDPY